jgi:F-type H+-transporting ATPase subunit delta
MGVLANHVPSIEQLKPGLIEIIEESGGSKQFFRMCFISFILRTVIIIIGGGNSWILERAISIGAGDWQAA